jgi:hypothetical protein
MAYNIKNIDLAQGSRAAFTQSGSSDFVKNLPKLELPGSTGTCSLNISKRVKRAEYLLNAVNPPSIKPIFS